MHQCNAGYRHGAVLKLCKYIHHAILTPHMEFQVLVKDIDGPPDQACAVRRRYLGTPIQHATDVTDVPKSM